MHSVTVIIKAYNEEDNIARAIESALAAVDFCKGQVILADSASTDRTIAIAQSYPVQIVRLSRPEMRCCGIGPQLGFQCSTSEFVYILDGDMQMDTDFLPKALKEFDANPRLAGVGGEIRETRADSMEFRTRINRLKRKKNTGFLGHLAGGGLYRRAALLDAGYMSDCNLHAFEEYDLGARLRRHGWLMMRLEDRAADHFAYRLNTWQLMRHRLKSGSFLGIGEVMRAAAANGYFSRLLTETRVFQLSVGVWLFWAAVIAAAPFEASLLMGFAFIALVAAAIVLVMAFRHRSLALGAFSVLSWHISALGLALGGLRPRRSPADMIPYTDLSAGRSAGAPSGQLS